MTTRGWSLSLLILGALLVGAPSAQAKDPALEAELRAVVEKNLDAYERMDTAATLATIDSDSPVYKETKEVLGDDVADPKVDATLVSFRYMGHDDEFAVARVKTTTAAAPGEKDFTNNTVDAIMLFHQEDGAWKIWDQHVLGVEVAK